MGKKRRTEEDWRRYSKFKEDNQKLKKEVTKLRKLVEKLSQNPLEDKLKQTTETESTKLTCDICGNSNLDIVPIDRKDGKFELRICKSCGHRSDMKKT